MDAHKTTVSFDTLDWITIIFRPHCEEKYATVKHVFVFNDDSAVANSNAILHTKKDSIASTTSLLLKAEIIYNLDLAIMIDIYGTVLVSI